MHLASILASIFPQFSVLKSKVTLLRLKYLGLNLDSLQYITDPAVSSVFFADIVNNGREGRPPSQGTHGRYVLEQWLSNWGQLPNLPLEGNF